MSDLNNQSEEIRHGAVRSTQIRRDLCRFPPVEGDRRSLGGDLPTFAGRAIHRRFDCSASDLLRLVVEIRRLRLAVYAVEIDL
ncbi:hypothetical protein Q3G72_023842 [Acer saccharum]|nr:hypothetical protein Q3G72_023842 [Acer saccharum]